MTKFRVAVVGGGIGGLCLATALLKEGNIHVDVYEASEKFGDIGAGITLWGRVCEVMRLMDLADDCMKASLTETSAATAGFSLRSLLQTGTEFGSIKFGGAWRLSRADFLDILLRRLPRSSTHLGKRLLNYAYDSMARTTTLRFADGTSATCDLLVGCDGIQSSTRTQMMRNLGTSSAARIAEPRWSGTVTYRIVMPISSLAAKNPRHSILKSGQIYCGKNKHIVGHPISQSTLGISINITDRAMENTRRPASWARRLGKKEFDERVGPLFVDCSAEVRQIIQTADSAIEWAMHDLEPLPFYVKGRLALIGDSAHASMPYLGAGAAAAIEDAYVLSRVLRADATTRDTLPLALEAYQAIRLPHGNRHILNARKALRTFQFNGSDGNDMTRVTRTIRRLFDETSEGIGQSGPNAEAKRAITWLEESVSRIH